MVNKIPISEPPVTLEDAEFLSKLIVEKQVSGRAPIVREFERLFSNNLGLKYSISCANGTSALHLAVRALKMKPGDEVIVPAFTMMSPIFALLYEGLKPVPVDVDTTFWNLQVEAIQKKMTSKTKAILVVHNYGNPANMPEIMEVARSHDLKVIEDCAEALGSSCCGMKTGTFGDISTFSFFANKLITTGEGGMVSTNCEELKDEIESLRDLCFGRQNKFLHTGLGYNYRMSALQAALGVSQLKRIDKHLEKIRLIAKWYNEALSNLDNIQLHKEPPNSVSSYWMYSVLVKSDKLDRDKVMMELSANGVETRPFFVPVTQQPVCHGIIENGSYPCAEFISKRGINLPSGLSLTQEDINTVSDLLRQVTA